MDKLRFICELSQINIELDPENNYVIGRKENSDICVPDSSVSRFHARLEYHREGWILSDLNSTNGTFVGEERIKEKILNESTIIRFGKITAEIILESPYSNEEELPCEQPLEEVSQKSESGDSEVTAEDNIRFYSNHSETLSQNYELPFSKEDIKLNSPREKADRYVSLKDFQDIPESLEEFSEIVSPKKKLVGNIQREKDNFFDVLMNLPEELEKFSDVDSKLDYVLDFLRDHVKAQRQLFMFYNQKHGWQMRRFLASEENEKKPFVSRTVIDRVLQAKKPLFLSSHKNVGEILNSSESMSIENISCIIAIPLKIKGNIDGIFLADSTRLDYLLHEEDFQKALKIISFSWSSILVSLLTEKEMEKEKSIKRLSRYLSPNVVKHVLKNENSCTLGGDLKEVTVLFSDLRGFTAMSEKMKPKDIIGDLNDYLRIMLQVIFAHKGTVDKFMGDAIMCYWGSPEKTDRDPLLAVQAAWQMQQELRDFNKNIRLPMNKAPLKMGIGINTGWVVCGNIGSLEKMEYTLIGDSVNIAQRLESLTKEADKSIIISETTYLKTKGNIVADELSSVNLKGKKYSTRIYSIEGIS